MSPTNLFKPNGLVTGIGSLPHNNVRTAVELVAEYSPELPFWPQLPQRSPHEGMIEQIFATFGDSLRRRPQSFGYDILAGRVDTLIHDLNHSEAFLTDNQASGFFAFKTALHNKRFDQAMGVKGQLTGPITLAFQLFVDNQLLLSHQKLVRAISRYVTRLAMWQASLLQYNNMPVIILLDEPCLGLFDPTWPSDVAGFLLSTLKKTITTIQSTGVLVGLHCCATPPFAALDYLQPDVISFDAHQYMEAFCTEWDVKPFLARGGIVTFGLVPTLSNLDQVDVYEIFYNWLLAANRVAEIPLLAQQTMITATCGLGLLNEDAAQESFKIARQVGALVERVAVSAEIPANDRDWL